MSLMSLKSPKSLIGSNESPDSINSKTPQTL